MKLAQPEIEGLEADKERLDPPDPEATHGTAHQDPPQELEAPPLPGGWPLDANLRRPDLPGTRGDEPAPTTPTPKPPPPLQPPRPPHHKPTFVPQEVMLKGHTLAPSEAPLVSAQEFRWFAIALGFALTMIACGGGGLLGFGIMHNGYAD